MDEDGDLIFQVRPPLEGETITSLTMLGDNSIWFTTQHQLWRFNANGEASELDQRWSDSALRSTTLNVLSRQVTQNLAPEITSEPITEASIAEPYDYDVVATDPDGDELTYQLSQSPNEMTIDELTGSINWLPQEAG